MRAITRALKLRVAILAIRYRGHVKLGGILHHVAHRLTLGIECAKLCIAHLRKIRYFSRYGDMHVNVMHLRDTPPRQ